MNTNLGKFIEYTAAVIPGVNVVPSLYNMIKGGMDLAEAKKDDTAFNKKIREEKIGQIGMKNLIDTSKSAATFQIIRGAFEIVPLFGIVAYGLGVLAYRIASWCSSKEQPSLQDLGENAPNMPVPMDDTLVIKEIEPTNPSEKQTPLAELNERGLPSLELPPDDLITPQKLDEKIQTQEQPQISEIAQTKPLTTVDLSPLTFAGLTKLSEDFLNSTGLKSSPTETNNLEKIAKTKERQDQVVQFAQQTVPILDDKVKVLIDDFLTYKRAHGLDVEKKLYDKMDQADFIVRLLAKRPLMFMTAQDQTLTRDGQILNIDSRSKAQDKDAEKWYEENVSYDEMQIGALLGISGPSFFINDGTYHNKGIIGETGSFEPQAIIAGLVGCRFEREGLNEYQHMLITPNQNTSEKGYGADSKAGAHFQPWTKFYGIKHFPSYTEVLESRKTKAGKERFVEIKGKGFLDVEIYKKRLRSSIEPFLQNITKQAAETNKKAYVRLTGLGLGIWKIAPIQNELMLEVVKELLKEGSYAAISDIEFIWVGKPGTTMEWQDGNDTKIAISCTDNTTCTKLAEKDQGKLLATTYAWDAGAFPGNEYWKGLLEASMDPATACASQIKDLHNIYVNPYLETNIYKMFKK